MTPSLKALAIAFATLFAVIGSLAWWYERRGRRVAEQQRYHDAKSKSEYRWTAPVWTTWHDSGRLDRLAALQDELRLPDRKIAECEQLVSRFVYDEYARLEAEMFVALEERAQAGQAAPRDERELQAELDAVLSSTDYEHMKPHQTVEAALEAYVLTEHMNLDETLLEKFGFTPQRAKQLLAADEVRMWMNHYSFPEQLTIENAERLLAEFKDDRRRMREDMMRGSDT